MKKSGIAYKLFLLATSALVLNFGCAKDEREEREWQQPENIKLEISLKDRNTSVDKSVEEAPALPVAEAVAAQSNTCTPQASANFGYGQNSASPWSQGLSNRSAWGQGLQQNAGWPQQGLGQNAGWPRAGAQGANAWPTSASTAPQSADLAPAIAGVDACVPPVGGAGLPYAPGYPGLGYPGYPAPVLPGFPALPFFDPYAPYYVADVVVSDDFLNDDDSFQNDDDSQTDDDDDVADDDAI